MKTIKILVLVSILAVTQSFALSKTQKNILLGLGAGAIIIHTLKSHNNNRYEKPHHKNVYVASHNSHRKYKKHHMRKYHKHTHHYGRASHHNKTLNKRNRRVHYRY